MRLKKNRSLFFVASLMFLFLFSANYDCRAENVYISVKDFGASGNGKTDDTKAIQNALNAAGGKTYMTLPNGVKVIAAVATSRTVYFPAGIYLISGTVKLGSVVNIKGDGAIIIGTNSFSKSANYAFDGSAWQSNISGLQFVGFNRALRLDSKNVDQGKVYISNCAFSNNGIAIYLSCQSSISTIENSRFSNNTNSLFVEKGDRVFFSKNWVKSGKITQNYGANIINQGGYLTLTENLLVPTSPASGVVEPAWINNYRTVVVDNIRQGGETGSFTLINNFAKFNAIYPVHPNAVIVKNSDCFAVYKTGTTKQPVVVRLFEMPNQIVLEDLRGMVDAPPIGTSDTKVGNPTTWANSLLNNKQLIKIRIANLIGQNPSVSYHYLPTYLKAFGDNSAYYLGN